MRLKLLTWSIGAVIGLSGLAFADQSTHVGKRILAKEEFIQRLAPVKTRGIRLNNPAPAAPTAAAGVAAADTAAQQNARQSISMEVQFGFDSDQLSSYARQQLAPLGEALQSNELSGLVFLIEGHTDAVGAESYNLNLSERRAASVRNFLYKNYGVDPSRLQVRGVGESALLDPANPAAGVNRRVVIATASS